MALTVGLYQAAIAEAAFAPREHMSFIAKPKLYAQLQVANKKQFACLDKLWTQESHWNPKALNKSSGAYGIAQFLPTTWGNYKIRKTSNAVKQIDHGLHYIRMRYGSSCKAWLHEKRYGWY